MIIYRPHRGGLKEAMEAAVEFSTFADICEYIVSEHTDDEWGPAFGVNDLVIDVETRDDLRIGWHDTRYVCTRKYYNESFDPPAPIGFCAENYEK